MSKGDSQIDPLQAVSWTEPLLLGIRQALQKHTRVLVVLHAEDQESWARRGLGNEAGTQSTEHIGFVVVQPAHRHAFPVGKVVPAIMKDQLTRA